MFLKQSEFFQIVFGERPNLSLALCSTKFQLRVEKKLIEGPGYRISNTFNEDFLSQEQVAETARVRQTSFSKIDAIPTNRFPREWSQVTISVLYID